MDLGGKINSGRYIELNLWQKRQAALLYYFSSHEYLKGLKERVDAFVKGVEFTLTEATRQGRVALMTSERWGVKTGVDILKKAS